MTAITCPHCQRVGKLKAPVPIGATVRCPGCRERFSVLAGYQDEAPDEVDQVLDLGIDLDGSQRLDRGLPLDEVIDEPAVVPQVPLPTAPLASPTSTAMPDPQPALSTATDKPLRLPVPPEPWFYRWLIGLADNLWSLGIGVSILAAMFFTCLLFAIPVIGSSQNPGPIVLGGFLAFLFVVPSLTSLFATSALLLLAVDHARNVRDMRYRDGG